MTMTRRRFVAGTAAVLAVRPLGAQQAAAAAAQQAAGERAVADRAAGEQETARQDAARRASSAPQAQANTPTFSTIRAAGAAAGILAGCAVAVERLSSDPGYAALVKAQAGIVVAENSMKFGPMRPTATTFDFTQADALLAFAQANGMQMRGHNFVWHRQLPEWFAGFVTPDNAAQVLVEHIERVGGRYAGKLHSWDVVNEAIALGDGLPNGLRDSDWQKLLSGTGAVPAYIELAFKTARRVDPKALLVYNDFGIEGEDPNSAAKRVAVLKLLRAMQDANIPIDALGIQSHISARGGAGDGAAYGKGLTKLIASARKIGLKVLLTEMDVNDRRLAPPVLARDAAVASTYADYLRLALADRAVIALLTWGITDKYTWLNGEDAREDKLPERPLPFDATLHPKPAASSIIAALQARVAAA